MVSGQVSNVCFTSSLSKCNGHLPFFICFLISLSFHVSANIRAIPCLSLRGHHSVHDLLPIYNSCLSTVVINYFPNFLPEECGVIQWEGAIWEGVEENMCSQTLLILYPSSCLEFLGGWWLSRWFPFWCFDVSACCPCIVRETSRIVSHMQSLDHWGEI